MEYTKVNDTTMKVVTQVEQNVTLDQLYEQKNNLSHRLAELEGEKIKLMEVIKNTDTAIAEATKLAIVSARTVAVEEPIEEVKPVVEESK